MKTKILAVLLPLLLPMTAAADSVQDQLNAVSALQHGHSTISLTAGPAWISSKVYVDPYNSNHAERWKPGVELGAEYTYTFDSGWGVGVSAGVNYTDYNGYSLNQAFIGPVGTYRWELGKRWNINSKFGMGIGRSFGDFNEYTGLAMIYKIGGEYMVSKKIGIGVDFYENATFYGSSNDNYSSSDSNSSNSTGRLGILMSLNFHL